MGYMNQMEVDPYINDVTDCPDDVSSGSEDEVSPCKGNCKDRLSQNLAGGPKVNIL